MYDLSEEFSKNFAGSGELFQPLPQKTARSRSERPTSEPGSARGRPKPGWGDGQIDHRGDAGHPPYLMHAKRELDTNDSDRWQGSGTGHHGPVPQPDPRRRAAFCRRRIHAGPGDRRRGPRRLVADDPGQPPPGRPDRSRLCRQGALDRGPDRRRQPRPDPRHRGVRPELRNPVQHLRQLLDQAVDPPRLDQHRDHHPPPGAHGHPPVEVAESRAGPRAENWARPRPSTRSPPP